MQKVWIICFMINFGFISVCSSHIVMKRSAVIPTLFGRDMCSSTGGNGCGEARKLPRIFYHEFTMSRRLLSFRNPLLWFKLPRVLSQ